MGVRPGRARPGPEGAKSLPLRQTRHEELPPAAVGGERRHGRANDGPAAGLAHAEPTERPAGARTQAEAAYVAPAGVDETVSGESSSTVSPEAWVRASSAEHDPPCARRTLRRTRAAVARLQPPSPSRSRDGTSSLGGGGERRGRGRTAEEEVEGRTRRAYEVLETSRLETSTASNAEPGTDFSAFRSALFQPASGTPLMNHGRAVVGEDHAVLLERPEDHLDLRREAGDVELAFSRNQAPIGGSRRRRCRPRGAPARRRRWGPRRGEADGVVDLARRHLVVADEARAGSAARPRRPTSIRAGASRSSRDPRWRPTRPSTSRRSAGRR